VARFAPLVAEAFLGEPRQTALPGQPHRGGRRDRGRADANLPTESNVVIGFKLRLRGYAVDAVVYDGEVTARFGETVPVVLVEDIENSDISGWPSPLNYPGDANFDLPSIDRVKVQYNAAGIVVPG
jgi:hypothetical protein